MLIFGSVVRVRVEGSIFRVQIVGVKKPDFRPDHYRALILNDDDPRSIAYGDKFVSFTDDDCVHTEPIRFVSKRDSAAA